MPNYQQGLYRVTVKTLAGATRLELDGLYTGLKYTLTRNRADKIDVSFNMSKLEQIAHTNGDNLANALECGLNEVFIARGLNTVAAGRIDNLTGAADGTNTSLSLSASGWLDLFETRYTGAQRVFTNVDGGTIAMTLMSESQALTNGDELVTQGTLRSTLLRTIEYEYKNIKEAIIQLSEAYGGFDFEFTSDKKFNTFARIGETTAIQLEYPGNLKSISVPFEGKSLVNQVTLRGQGQGTEQLVATRNNTASAEAYRLRQRIMDYSDVKETDTLNKHGDELLRLYALPLSIPQIVLKENHNGLVLNRDLWIGDTVTIRTPFSDFMNQIEGATYRVEQISVSVDANGRETVSLNLSKA